MPDLQKPSLTCLSLACLRTHVFDCSHNGHPGFSALLGHEHSCHFLPSLPAVPCALNTPLPPPRPPPIPMGLPYLSFLGPYVPCQLWPASLLFSFQNVTLPNMAPSSSYSSFFYTTIITEHVALGLFVWLPPLQQWVHKVIDFCLFQSL